MYPVCESRVFFESGDKPIPIDCYIPQANGERFPAVVGLHGAGGGYAVVANPARLLAAHGFAVYVPHYFARTGTEQVSGRLTILRHGPAWMKTVWDIMGFVGHERTVDRERIALLGFSLGGYLALGIAAMDDRVKAVVDFSGGFPREMKLFARRFCPVLILHGEADGTVPLEEAHSIARMLGKRQIPYEMKTYPGVGHLFQPEIMKDAGQRALNFLRLHLAKQKAETLVASII